MTAAAMCIYALPSNLLAAFSAASFLYLTHFSFAEAALLILTVRNSSQASCLSRNSAMDDSGDSYNSKALQASECSETARPYESELLDLRPTLHIHTQLGQPNDISNLGNIVWGKSAGWPERKHQFR